MARHLLAAYSGKNIPARASDGFIRQCFDSFSNSFDEVLSRLDYKAPALVADCANRLLSSDGRSHRVLDIGCGTGLCGPLLKPIASALTGVDLSKGMLAKAEKRGVYDELIESELTEFMCTAPGQFDLVTCVDTFVYFGDLRDALLACSNTLVMGGHLIFTVEQHTHEEHAEGFWLRPHGRYSHSRENVIGLLTEAGIMVLDVEDVILRNEGGERVRGMLVSARKE
jgi:predicted TPR repeat methyltransferase